MHTLAACARVHRALKPFFKPWRTRVLAHSRTHMAAQARLGQSSLRNSTGWAAWSTRCWPPSPTTTTTTAEEPRRAQLPPRSHRSLSRSARSPRSCRQTIRCRQMMCRRQIPQRGPRATGRDRPKCSREYPRAPTSDRRPRTPTAGRRLLPRWVLWAAAYALCLRPRPACPPYRHHGHSCSHLCRRQRRHRRAHWRSRSRRRRKRHR